MKLDENKIHSVIYSNDGIIEIYRWYLMHNSSLSLPYHNITNTFGILYHIINIYENSRKPDSDYGFSLNESDLFILIVSGLFVNYNNSGGKFPVEIDAENAMDGLETCLLKFFDENEYTKNTINICKNNIYAAICSSHQNNIELTIQQKILKESISLDIFYDNFISQGIISLYNESRSKEDFMLFVSNTIKTLLETIQNFNLKYSKDLWNTYGNKLMENINIFSKIILSDK